MIITYKYIFLLFQIIFQSFPIYHQKKKKKKKNPETGKVSTTIN